MAYVKPGVEITQVNVTTSPTLIAPDLATAIIAPAYKVVPSTGTGSYNYTTPAVSGINVITLQGITSDLYLDKDSVIVDLILPSNNSRLCFTPDQLIASDGGSTVTIPSGLVTEAFVGAKIYVGYRAMWTNLAGQFLTLDSTDAYTNYFGENQQVWDNPLPFALLQADMNTGSAVYGVAVKADDYSSVVASGSISTEHIAAQEVLSTQEVYALAPMTKDSTTITSYTTHVDTLSAATNKKERIVFIGSEIIWKTAGNVTTTTPALADKAKTALAIQAAVYAVADNRVFNVYPDVVYYAVSNQPIQKIKGSFLTNMYDLGTTEYAILNKTYTLADKSVVSAGTIVTDAIWTRLKADTANYSFDVLVPMPSFFMAAAIAGQVSGQPCEQGFTNLPFAGPTSLKYSNDYFLESQLNTMVGGLGGAYIIVKVGNSVYSRHQLSTNANTVEFRELNITKSIDFTAKFIRNTVSGLIGRSLITPSFLTSLNMIIGGVGALLVKNGRLNSFAVGSVVQDAVNPDTVRAAVTVKPKYPVNYIKIDLIF